MSKARASGKVAFVRGLRTAGATVTDGLVLSHLRAFPGGGERLARLGLAVRALATWDDILRLDPGLDAADRTEIGRFLPVPAAWSAFHGGRAAPVGPPIRE